MSARQGDFSIKSRATKFISYLATMKRLNASRLTIIYSSMFPFFRLATVYSAQRSNYMHRTVFGKTVFPPIEDDLHKGIRVLSVKAGPNFWINDMAEAYPNSHFTGTDFIIFPISNPPRNCHYCIADAGKELPFPDNTFDYVAQHDSVFDYMQDEWTTVINEIIRVTKPGGWIQLVEPGGLVQDIGPNLSIWLIRGTWHWGNRIETTHWSCVHQ
ncbi:hypothetical protein BX666DRAFT_187846 [Dichotomocladium elegans]|nr:hypothetical protein BX666DRAFT_187846 [Dichotomocladium elegans]